MHHPILLCLGLLLAVCLLIPLSQCLRVPYPVLLALSGLVINWLSGLPVLAIDPEVICLLFLPASLYELARACIFQLASYSLPITGGKYLVGASRSCYLLALSAERRRAE